MDKKPRERERESMSQWKSELEGMYQQYSERKLERLIVQEELCL